jgi:hypothetical protein
MLLIAVIRFLGERSTMPRISSTLIESLDRPHGRHKSESERSKKMHEEIELDHFLEAYQWVMDERLQVMVARERPDFLCARPDGSIIGVELVKIVRDPESAFADEVLFGRERMKPDDALNRISDVVCRKEEKRRQSGWLHPESTILVVQLMDCPTANLAWGLAPENFDPHGFEEIWLADFSEMEAYGTVELFGLYPEHLWGRYERTNVGKPYG